MGIGMGQCRAILDIGFSGFIQSRLARETPPEATCFWSIASHIWVVLGTLRMWPSFRERGQEKKRVVSQVTVREHLSITLLLHIGENRHEIVFLHFYLNQKLGIALWKKNILIFFSSKMPRHSEHLQIFMNKVKFFIKFPNHWSVKSVVNVFRRNLFQIT
jgi:hypothetical protein